MTLRNEVNRAMRKAEAEYWWDGLGNKVKGSSDFWKLVKQITKKREVIWKNWSWAKWAWHTSWYDDKDEANTLNSFFAT